MTANQGTPSVSVCIPTIKQPAHLKRAVASVIAQTHQDWELIISDDENPPGETWEYLQELKEQDARIRVLRNPGRHGQVPNMNHAMSQARGAWIKPLHHDDALRPDCLAVLLSACRGLPGVVLVSSLATRYLGDGRPQRALRRRGRTTFELIPQKYAQLGMYLQDCNVGLPTQVMVRREAVEKGAWFEEVPGIVAAVDTLWDCAVLKHGDVLFVNQVLVEHHQHPRSITATLTDEQVEAEYPIVLRREFECIDPGLKPAPLEVVVGMVKCIRALHRWKNGKVREGLRLFREARRLASWILAARWLVNQSLPGLLHMVPRVPVRVGCPDGPSPLGKKQTQ